MICPVCKEYHLVNCYVSDPKTKAPKSIGKICLNCQLPIKPTRYFHKRRSEIHSALAKISTKPHFRVRKPCPKCFGYNIKYEKIPKKKNEKPRRKGICQECKSSTWYEDDYSRIKLRKLP